VSKETYYSVKIDLRERTSSNETYYSVKRDLLQCQKRPTRAYLVEKAAPIFARAAVHFDVFMIAPVYGDPVRVKELVEKNNDEDLARVLATVRDVA
jgi:hypothetical protein